MVDRCNQEVAIQALVIKAPQGLHYRAPHQEVAIMALAAG